MNYLLDLQVVSKSNFIPLNKIKLWVYYLLRNKVYNIEFNIKIVDKLEMLYYSNRYKNNCFHINVLTFPSNFICNNDYLFIGDIVICSSVIFNDNKKSELGVDYYWFDVIVHSVINLIYPNRSVCDEFYIQNFKKSLENYFNL